MAIDQLPMFMQAIAEQESGGKWDAVGPHTGETYGRAVGRWQIMENIWPSWAREAGLPGADWRDPEAQEHVARFKMRQYYQRYGRWDLVAIAWFAGPGRANQAAEEGIESVGNLDDVLGTTVSQYVAKMQSTMGGGAAAPVHEYTGDWKDTVTAEAQGKTAAISPDARFVESRQASSKTMADIMSFISDASRRTEGGRELDARALFGLGGDEEGEPEEADTGGRE